MTKRITKLLCTALAILMVIALLPGEQTYAASKKYKLSFNKSNFYYNGKSRVPKITVRNSKGKKLSSKNYTVTYKDSSNKVVVAPTETGTYTAKVRMKNGYTMTKVFRIKTNTYYIKYDSNGGEGQMKKKTCKSGKTYTFPENTFAREGYTFTGWNTSPDGTGIQYNATDSFTNLSLKYKETITLYAQWLCTATHRLTGDFSDSYKNSVYYTNLQNVAVSDSIPDMIANVALSQVGYHEADSGKDFSGNSKGTNNYTEYGRWCGLKNGYGAWCSAFVSWVLYMADVPDATICTYADYAGDYFGGAFTPYTSKMTAADFHKGDIVAVNWSGSKSTRSNHVEIVYNDPAVDGVVLTVSGNSGSGEVVKRNYNLLTQKSCKVFGFIRTKY